eukprot:8402203-Pyramimonas_sp.AAC.1
MLNGKNAENGKCSLGLTDAAAYVHVDDGLAMAVGPDSERPKCDELMQQVADGCGREGFLVTVRVEAGDDLKAVGYRAQ